MNAPAAKFPGGVDPEKIDASRLALYLKGAGVKNDASPEESAKNVILYARHAADRIKAGEAAYECENCGSNIAGKEVSCPVCGVSTEIDLDAVSDEPPAGLTVRDLDAAVARVKSTAVSAAANYWRLGKELLGIYQSRMYRVRIDKETKKPLYRSFRAFLDAEIPMSYVQARRIMAIGLVLDQKTIESVGSVRRLELVAKIPEEARGDILKRMEGRTFRDFDREVKSLFPQARGPSLSPRDSASRTPTRKPRPAATPAPKPDRVTAVERPGAVEITLKRARSSDLLVGSEPAINGVVVEYAYNPKTHALRITRKRT